METIARQQRAENTRTRLVCAAAHLFERHGFAGTNISDITRAAGVTKGALYFHFTAKEELVEAVQGEVDRALESMAAEIAAAGVPAAQALVDLSHALGRALNEDSMVRAGFRIARECGERGRPFLDSYLTWSAIVARLVREVEPDDGPGGTGGPESAAAVVLAMSVGLEALLAAGLPRADVSESLTMIWRLVLPGLVPPDDLLALVPEGSELRGPGPSGR